MCVSSYCGRLPAWGPYLAQWGKYSVCVSVLTVAGYLLGALTLPNGVSTVCVSVLTVAGYLLGALTLPNGVNTATGCTRLLVLHHLVEQQAHCVRLEVHVTIEGQQERVLSLQGAATSQINNGGSIRLSAGSLHHGNIGCHIRTGTDLLQCTLMVTL